MTRAIIFDFNGTLSDDEPIMCEIFIELFAEHGKPLSAQEYYDELAGLSDPEIVRTWLGKDHPDVDEVIAERINRYRAAVGDGSSIHEHVREAVRYAAERVPAGLAECFRVIVSSDDVTRGKPHPEGYLSTLRLLGDPKGALVFEDTEAGITSAKAAGLRVIAKLGTLDPQRLRDADELADRIDVELMRRCLS
jgi:beta-phosphoglucomutase